MTQHLPCYVAPTGTYTIGHHLNGCELPACRGCVACPTHPKETDD